MNRFAEGPPFPTKLYKAENGTTASPAVSGSCAVEIACLIKEHARAGIRSLNSAMQGVNLAVHPTASLRRQLKSPAVTPKSGCVEVARFVEHDSGRWIAESAVFREAINVILCPAGPPRRQFVNVATAAHPSFIRRAVEITSAVKVEIAHRFNSVVSAECMQYSFRPGTERCFTGCQWGSQTENRTADLATAAAACCCSIQSALRTEDHS